MFLADLWTIKQQIKIKRIISRQERLIQINQIQLNLIALPSMKSIFIDNLTIISHSQYELQSGTLLQRILEIMPYIQYLSLVIPKDGWGQWKYSDGYLNFIEKVCNYFTVTPFFEYENSIIYYPVTILSLILMILLLLYLSCFSLRQQNKEEYTNVRTNNLSTFLLFSISTLQIPCYKFYFQQVIQSQHYSVQFILNIITIILYTIFVFFGQFILRQYSFIPYHPFQIKLTKLKMVQMILTITCIYFILEQSLGDISNVIGIILLHANIILKLLDHLYFNPDLYYNCIFHFTISFTLEILLIIVTINVLSNNQLIEEKQLPIYLMLTFSLALSIGPLLYKRLYLFNLNKQIFELYQIYLLFSLINEIKEGQITNIQLQIYELIRNSQYYSNNQIIIKMQFFELKFSDFYKLGLKIIQSQIENIFISKILDQEELKLFQVSFLTQIINKHLIAYVELQKYDINQNQKSLYYKLIRQRIGLMLQEKIHAIQVLHQSEIVRLQLAKQHDAFDSLELFKFFSIEDQFRLKTLDIIKNKQLVWKKQIEGSKSIYEYEQASINLSKKMIDLIVYLRKEKINVMHDYSISQMKNIYNLKIASVFNSFILNDFTVSLLCEQKMIEQFKIETQLTLIYLKKSTVLLDQTLLMILSIVRSLGEIININKNQIADFFEMDPINFQEIKNVKELMPQFFAQYHDQLLHNYIQFGKSDLTFLTRLTFAKNGKGFLMPQYINISNNFQYLDDFTLFASLTKLQESSLYILFDEFGQIIGITEEFCNQVIQNDYQSYFLENIHLFYIYMFFPHIHVFMNEIQTLKDNDLIVEQKGVILYYFQNLNQIQKLHQDIVFNGNHKSYNLLRQKSQLFDNLSSQQSLIPELITEKRDNYTQLTIAKDNQEKQLEHHQIIQFFKYIDEYKDKDSLKCNLKISLQSFGRNEIKRHYFILEIQDILEKQKIVENKNTTPKNFVRKSKIKNLSSKVSLQQQSYKKFSYINDIQSNNQILSPKEQDQQHQSFLKQSHQNSQIINYASENRLSVIKNVQDSSGSNDEQIYSKEFDNQNKNEIRSNQGLKLVESYSSTEKSASSGYQAIETINKFKKKTSLIVSLLSISFLILSIFIILIIFIFLNYYQISNYNQQSIDFIDQINLPMKLNKYFLSLFSFSWIQSLELGREIFFSKYISQSMKVQQNNLASLFSDLSSSYDQFIALEQGGFLNQLKIVNLDLTTEIIDYTQYISIFEVQGYQLLNAQSPQTKMLDLFKYRLNYYTIIQNNYQIINSLNSQYQVQYTQQMDDLTQLIVIQISILLIITLIQLYFWVKNERYCKSILLLSCRLTENKANEQINRFTLISEILQQTFGDLGWKQQNCHKLCYQEEKSQKQQNNYKRIKKTVKINKKVSIKKNTNRTSTDIPLNSRILNQSIFILKKIILIFIQILLQTGYLCGILLLYQYQAQQINPTQNLASNFIEFNLYIESSIITAGLVKSESVIFKQFKRFIPQQNDSIDQLLNEQSSALMLQELYNVNTTYSDDIYQSIIQSKTIVGEDEIEILQIYSGDYCESFTVDEMYFCNKNMTSDEFTQTYGQYNDTDNNTQYLSQGIVGIVSYFQTFLNQFCQYELDYGQLNTDEDEIEQIQNSKQYDNIFIEHFIDTYLGFQKFLALIQNNIVTLLNQQLTNSQICIFIFGLSVLIIICIGGIYIILIENLRLIQIRLLISLLPIEIMLDIQTISLLKQIN